MQIVINIGDNFYKRAMIYKGEQFPDNDDLLSALITAVNNGVPLPRGHGRIIDERRISKCKQIGLIIKDGNTNRCLLTDAPTIVKADEVEE